MERDEELYCLLVPLDGFKIILPRLPVSQPASWGTGSATNS
jgi:hypothetical protein